VLYCYAVVWSAVSETVLVAMGKMCMCGCDSCDNY